MNDARRFILETGDAVLCLIDMQERLFRAMHDTDPLLKNTQILVNGARLLGVPILWSEQYPKGLGPTLDAIAADLPADGRAEKLDFSAWREPSFQAKLVATGRKAVVLPGIETHVCVMQTALDLLAEGYRVFVPADAVSSRTPENKEIGLALMKEAGAVITSVEACVFQMFAKAGGDAFKAFQRLIV